MCSGVSVLLSRRPLLPGLRFPTARAARAALQRTPFALGVRTLCSASGRLCRHRYELQSRARDPKPRLAQRDPRMSFLTNLAKRDVCKACKTGTEELLGGP